MARRWQDKYEREGEAQIEGGGQGDALIARPLEGGDLVFVKVLRHQNDIMRRKRMHREVEAYRTLSHTGIPALIESNSNKFDDLEYKLFLVSKLIHGSTLTAHIQSHGPMSAANALVLTERLLNIVAYCHGNGYVHRDIKPDNILLRDGDFSDPVLVDFGLSFEASIELQGTELGEELGNRFLRLPELSAGSEIKRDPRSDLAFVAGIYLYCLTGTMPSTLIDGNGVFPHQREGVRQRLQESIDQKFAKRLLRFFDQSFQINIDHRHRNADDMLRDLASITADDGVIKSNTDRTQALKERMAANDVAYEQQVVGKLNRALELIRSAMNELQRQFNLSNSQTGYELDPKLRVARNSLALMPHGTKAVDYVRFSAEVIGDEIVLSALYRDQQFLGFGRLPFSTPFNDNALEAEIQDIFLSQMEDSLP